MIVVGLHKIAQNKNNLLIKKKVLVESLCLWHKKKMKMKMQKKNFIEINIRSVVMV